MSRVFRVLAPLIVLVAAAGTTLYLIVTRPRATEQPAPPLSALVDVLIAAPTTVPARVRAMGVVVPAREITATPEVSGLVIRRHPNLEPGGRVAAGEELIAIDPRDYETAVDQAAAAVEKARFDLAVELGRKTVAEEEWKQLGDQVPASEEGRALALREPHLQQARAALLAAESALRRARLNLERTRLRIPFDALVLEKFADVGQFVSPPTRVARMVATDVFWVQVSLPVSEAGWLIAPDANGEGGSAAALRLDLGRGRRAVWQGRVTRLLGDLEPAGRMARALIAVSHPLDVTPAAPLPLGAYVEAEIIGRPMDGVFEIPRGAVREGDCLWLANASDQLEIRPIQILRRQPDIVVVHGGLAAGDRVVVSRIPLPIPGMQLRITSAHAERLSHPKAADPAADAES